MKPTQAQKEWRETIQKVRAKKLAPVCKHYSVCNDAHEIRDLQAVSPCLLIAEQERRLEDLMNQYEELCKTGEHPKPCGLSDLYDLIY